MQSSFRFRPRFGKLVTTPDIVESKEKPAGEHNLLAIMVSVQFIVSMSYELHVYDCASMVVIIIYI